MPEHRRGSWIANYDDVELDFPIPPEKQIMDSALPELRPVGDKSPNGSDCSHSSTDLLSFPSPTKQSISPPPTSRISDETDPGARTTPVPSSKSFVSSPLNPSTSPTSRRFSSVSRAHMTRLPSEESRVLSCAFPSSQSPLGHRASMILYKLADASDDHLLPPRFSRANRDSYASSSGDSFVSLSSDSKYPLGMGAAEGGGIVPYAYDPALDDEPEDDDKMHDPTLKMKTPAHFVTWRGFANLGTLIVILLALLTLFVAYPIMIFNRDNTRDARIAHNARINASGQALDSPIRKDRRSQEPMLLRSVLNTDSATPDGHRYRSNDKGDLAYELVYSDEFDTDGRSPGQDDDPFWSLTGGASLTNEGALAVPVDSEVALRIPICLDHGFVEVGLLRHQESGDIESLRAWWTGTWKTVRDNATLPTTGVSLYTASSLDIRIGRDNGDSSDTILLDYIRIYQSVHREWDTTALCGLLTYSRTVNITPSLFS